MRRLGGPLRRAIDLLRRTPLHPQWLYRDPRGHLPELDALAHAGILLDIGAADGWLGRRLPSGWHYVALDHPEVGVEWYGARPDVCGDASALPFSEASFGAVALLEVVEHLERPDAAFAEIDRVLKPGGVLLCSVPFLYPVHDAPRDFQRMTVHGLHHLAARLGWEVQSVRRIAPGFQCLAVQFGVALGSVVVGPDRIRPVHRAISFALLPFVPMVNLFCALLSALFPDAVPLAGGHVVVYRKSGRGMAA